jgi:hypothetical protein
MAKLSRREFIEMKKKALKQLRHLVLGYYIGTFKENEENGCIKMRMGYDKIEVVDAPFFTGIRARILVMGNGGDSVSICANDVEILENWIDALKELVYEIQRSMRVPSSFDKERIKEAYFAVQNIQRYLEKLYSFAEADS